MLSTDARTDMYCLHGLGIELSCEVPALAAQIEHALGPFLSDVLPPGFARTIGTILPYEQSAVLRHLSNAARRVSNDDDLIELYQDGERFWLVDERVGLIEMNLLRGTWRSWVLPRAGADPVRLVDTAVLWPLAQLLRPKGVYLVPAASVARAGWGVMIVAPFGIEPELRTLIRAGYRVLGQRWTAIREEGSRLELMHLPGQVERLRPPHLRGADAGPWEGWVDLTHEHLGCSQNHAYCDAVLVADPGRRPRAHLTELSPPRAVEILRAGWPMPELHPSRRFTQLPMKLAQRARCCQLQMSRQGEDLLVLLDSLRYHGRGPANHANPARHATPDAAVA